MQYWECRFLQQSTCVSNHWCSHAAQLFPLLQGACLCLSACVNVNQNFLVWLKQRKLLHRPQRHSVDQRTLSGKDWRKRSVLRRWRKTDREEDAWMSDDSEFQRSEAATGNDRRLTCSINNSAVIIACPSAVHSQTFSSQCYILRQFTFHNVVFLLLKSLTLYRNL